MARALPDWFVKVAANASLDTGGSMVYSLQLLAGGRLVVGTKTGGEQFFAYAPVAPARLGSRMEVAANALLALLADGHFAVLRFRGGRAALRRLRVGGLVDGG